LGADRREVIEQLFIRYGRGVGSYILARVGNLDLAEEITAQVFLTVVRRFDTCRDSPAGWLWSIVRSELARHFRRRRPLPLDEDLVDPAESPSAHLERHENDRRLHVAMEQLTEQQQQIVYLKFFQKTSNKEIARIMELTPSNVGVKVHRAMIKLREMLEAPSPQLDG